MNYETKSFVEFQQMGDFSHVCFTLIIYLLASHKRCVWNIKWLDTRDFNGVFDVSICFRNMVLFIF